MNEMELRFAIIDGVHKAIEEIRKERYVKPHKNYDGLSKYWCECGWFLGEMNGINYCPNCGGRIDWNG